jgi:hypothetical protein
MLIHELQEHVISFSNVKYITLSALQMVPKIRELSVILCGETIG